MIRDLLIAWLCGFVATLAYRFGHGASLGEALAVATLWPLLTIGFWVCMAVFAFFLITEAVDWVVRRKRG